MGVIFFQKKRPPVKGKKGYCYSKSLGIFKQMLGDFCAWAYSESAFSFNLRLCLMLQVIMFIRSKMRIRTSLFGQKSVLHGKHKDQKGFNIDLNLLPLDGKLVLREVGDNQPEKK